MGSKLAAEIIDGEIANQYLWGFNLFAREEPNSNSIYYEYNAHGDVIQLTDWNGAKIREYHYDAFGVEQSPDPADTNPFRYCGEYLDQETGSYYLRARYYDPVIGRFTQQDSVMYTIQKPPTDQQIIEPLSLNLYAYAYQNPVKYRDPSGNMPEAFDTAAEIAQADGPYLIADLAAGGYLIYAGGKWVWTNRVEIANNFVSGAKFVGGKIADGAQWLSEEIQDGWLAITNLYKEHTNNARPSTKGKHEEGETRRQRNQNGEKGDARCKPNPNKRRQ